MGFYAFGTRFQSLSFARKDISWRVKKLNAKQNRFQIVTIFFTFFFSIFLRHYVTYVPAGFGQVLLALILGCNGRIQRHGLQSLPPSPKRAERKGRRRPFREAGSGHKQWNTVSCVDTFSIISKFSAQNSKI